MTILITAAKKTIIAARRHSTLYKEDNSFLCDFYVIKGVLFSLFIHNENLRSLLA
mgnify:FL=1